MFLFCFQYTLMTKHCRWKPVGKKTEFSMKSRSLSPCYYTRAHFYTLLSGVCASCGASFPVSRRKLPDRECCVTSFRQGGYTPLHRLCGYPLCTCRPQTVLRTVRRQQVAKKYDGGTQFEKSCKNSFDRSLDRAYQIGKEV